MELKALQTIIEKALTPEEHRASSRELTTLYRRLERMRAAGKRQGEYKVKWVRYQVMDAEKRIVLDTDDGAEVAAVVKKSLHTVLAYLSLGRGEAEFRGPGGEYFIVKKLRKENDDHAYWADFQDEEFQGWFTARAAGLLMRATPDAFRRIMKKGVWCHKKFARTVEDCGPVTPDIATKIQSKPPADEMRRIKAAMPELLRAWDLHEK